MNRRVRRTNGVEIALELHRLAEAMLRQRLRRLHPSWARPAIEAEVAKWRVARVPCPVGTFAVPSNCPTDTGFLGYVPEKCAYYREWDASGTSLGMLPATAGSVTVTGNEQSCTIQATFSFSGVQWTDSFTVTNLLAPKPWCKSS